MAGQPGKIDDHHIGHIGADRSANGPTVAIPIVDRETGLAAGIKKRTRLGCSPVDDANARHNPRTNILPGRTRAVKWCTSMRLFIGIALAPNLADRLSEVLNELRPAASIAWSPVENLHITSKFIGEWPEHRLTEVTSALGSVAVAAPFAVTLAGFGFFPNPHQPHSFFAGVHAEAALNELAAAIERALVPLGVRPETRPYRPHVTLARIRRTSDIRALREHVAATPDFHFGGFDVSAFHLYLSTPGESRSLYTKLATYDLMREKNAIS
jgi:2'-5' RNA ligase